MSNPVFTQPRFDYESFAERYVDAEPGEVIAALTADTVDAGRSRQVGMIHYLQRRGLKPQVDFQTSLANRQLFVKKLTTTRLEV